MTTEQTEGRITTQELLFTLQEAEEVDPLLDRLSPQMEAPTFPQQLFQYMEERGLTVTRLSELAMLSRSFMYQLCSGDRAPGRDIVLRLALVLELSVDETQRLLRTAQKGALYPRVRRDAVLIFCLNRSRGLCGTLERLHGQRPPVVHGDVRLESVIRTPAGECVLTSLGAARQGDPRSDVYALGAVLHELASGEARLEEGTVPSALRAVVDGCVRPSLEERYAGAGEVERALTRAGRPWGRFFPRGGRPCK